MVKALSLDLPFQLIQSIRLAHAIMETNYEVYLEPKDEEKFLWPKEKFGVRYKVNNELPPKLSGIVIVHSKPQTSIGFIERPLIFPHSIFAYSKSLWCQPRNIKFSFAGLITESRKDFFQRVIKLQYPQSQINWKRFGKPNLFSRIKSKLEHKLGIQDRLKPIKFRYKDILFWSSKRGRNFPIKAWDDEYFRLLANSQFVLCPSGDYTWSYRFFEAAMCGAIPIVEEYCSVYDGFRFKTTEEMKNNLNWSIEDAEHNYNTCLQRLTIPLESLQEEIGRLLLEQ
ncbi:hypothetical protein [Okeania sp.]|uniref:hypothetical protein n=1 Tax=Okeania sp. TaxID=3100323 RepID=UPI002B4B26EE|nr:hypothetical protein [Okeania sp.]MEB3339825.1 hypothetical protein [Okeania sp.]